MKKMMTLKNSEKTTLEMVLQPKVASKRAQNNVRISSAVRGQTRLTAKGERLKFEYDFGDSWEHDLWVKGVRDYAAGEEPVIKLLKAYGECPFENCGGVWGYVELLELKKRSANQTKTRNVWNGITYPKTMIQKILIWNGCKKMLRRCGLISPQKSFNQVEY